MAAETPEPYVGRPIRKIEDPRLLTGRGRFVDDVRPARLLHAAFVRSALAHARLERVDVEAARTVPGVVAVYTAADLAGTVAPWSGLLNWPGMVAAEQHPLATDTVRHVGEPVAIVVAESRALAEDAAELVEVDYRELPAVVDPVVALDGDGPLVHESLGTNRTLELHLGGSEAAEIDAVLAGAAHVVSTTMSTGRHTATAMEPRGILAEADRHARTLTIRVSTQASHMLQATYARILGLRESDVRVLAEDVGGAFGMKAHVYPDEVAVCAASLLLDRPVKWIQDRAEAFQSDTAARDERVTAELAVDADGRILGLRSDVVSDGGAYSVYPRSMVTEGIQVGSIMPGPYQVPAYRSRVRVAMTNKTPLSVYRGVGHPVAILVMETLMDLAAAECGLSRDELRRRNLVPSDAFPFTSVTGHTYDSGSFVECLDTLVAQLDPAELAERRARASERGRVLGVGIACFVELTAPGAQFYGGRGAPITAHDQVGIRMEPDGTVTLLMGTAGQGQGLRTTAAQVVADRLGIPPTSIHVVAGDTSRTPHGSGVWGSRSAVVTAGAADHAGALLAERVVELAAHLLEVAADDVELRAGVARVRGVPDGPSLTLREIADSAHYRSFEFPEDADLGLSLVGLGPPPAQATFNNGAHAAVVEVDPELGLVDVVDYVVVEDCGVLLNPKIVDEQIRGGVAQGLGGALFEHLRHDERGQLLTTSMLDYHLPTADVVPDIRISHVETPSPLNRLGTKGAGEAGAAGAPAAIHSAVNDALAAADGGRVWQQPITPEAVLAALARPGPTPAAPRGGPPA